MLFKDAFKAKSYQKVYAVGYYTPINSWCTIQTRIGKQNAISALKIPERIFNSLKVDDADKSITNLSDFPELTVVKDEDSGFKKLEYHPVTKKEATQDVDED